MRKLTLFIATLLLTVAKTVAFEVSTSVTNPEHLYFITNGNNAKVGKNAVNSNEAGCFAFYAVEGVDKAYYIYSLDEKKWFDYDMEASYGGQKNFITLSSEKGNYFFIETCAQNKAYYQIRPYNSTGVASIYLNYYQGVDGRSTIGLWTTNGDGDAGSRWTFTETGYILEASSLSNDKVYNLTTTRGWLIYNENNASQVSSTASYTGFTTGMDVEACQWAIYKSEKTANYYLYNIGAGKFVGKNSDEGGRFPFEATVTNDIQVVKSTTGTSHAFVFSTDNYGAINHFSHTAAPGVANWQGNANQGGLRSLSDAGSAHRVVEVGTISNEALAKIENLVAEYEINAAKDELDAAIAKAQSYTIGEGVGCYTASTQANLEEIVAFYNGITTSTPIADVVAKTSEVNELVASMSLNMPEAGKYYTFSNGDKYITSNVATNNRIACAAKDASAIYYFDGTHLKSFTTGRYIGLNETAWTFSDTGSTITFQAAANNAISKYNINSGNRWLHLSTDNGNYVNRCATNTCGDAHNWVIEEVTQLPVAKVGDNFFYTFAEALEATKTMTGDVTVVINDKVTLNQALTGSYSSIKFVGNDTDAEIYLDVQGYITAAGKKVAFEGLTLSKSQGGFIGNAGFMNVAFGVYEVAEVTYTNCTFANGAYAAAGNVTFTGCTFKRSHDKYGLWAYGNVDVTVDGCTFADYRGIKMYAENGANAGVEKANLTVKNTNFSAVDNKPAIVLTYGESVALEGNTYSETGVFELDLDGKPNGVAVTSDVAPTCKNDNGACGVLVDGKIYTTVAQAAEVATETSTVTLLHSSNETVEFPMGTTIEKNGFTADNVTTAQPFADYVVLPISMDENNYKAMFGTNTVTDGNTYYATLQAAVEAVAQNAGVTRQANATLYCKPGADVGSLQHAPVVSTLTIYGNGANVTGGSERDFDLGNTDPNGGRDITADMTLTVKHLNGCGAWGTKATEHTVNLVFENCANMGKVFISGTTGTLNITMTGCAFEGVLKEAVYSNADGAITLNNVAFSNLNKAVNLNHKAAGTQTVTINGCSFTDCGNDVAADQIPVRVLSSVDGGKSVLNVSNTTFSGTPTGGADILLDYAVGLTEATVAGTTANVVVEKENNVGTKTEVSTDNNYEFTTAKPVANIGNVEYATLEEAAAVAQDGDVITLNTDATLSAELTLPAGVTLNGNGKQINGDIIAGGEITFAGVTKATSFNVKNVNTVINIPAGASLQLTGTGRMVIGHGCTFNITGTIADAKTANVADVTPSLVMPGASFTGAGVTFNVTNAYISAPSSYCSSSKSASGTFDFNINNSIWENAGKFAFESQSTAATVNFDLVESVLNTGSHLVFGVSRGEVVIDNSNVNVGKSNQIENQSTMTIKNGSVVNGAVATSSNAKNPGTVIVDNATYAVTGEFSGSDLGTGTLIIKKGATVSAGSITKANITVDAEGMAAGDEINLTANLSSLGGTLSVINNDKLEAKIVDGKIVLAAKPVAEIGEQGYATLQAAFDAVKDGETITLIDNVTVSVATAAYNDGTYIDGVRYTGDKSFTVDFNGKTVTDDGCVNDYLIYINNKGEKASEITFTNGTIVSKNGCWSAVCVNSSAATQNVVLNLNGMNITNSNDAEYSGNPVVRVRNLATVNVNDKTVITSNGASYGVAANTDGSTLNINEGATIVQQNSGTTGGNSVFAAVGGKGVINIKGGTITSDKFGVHTMTTGTPVINISGGTITAPVALKSSTNGDNGELATINVTGGTINGTLETYTDNGKIVVSGGTFSNAVEEKYCAEGFIPAVNADGTFGVEKAPVASINGTKYTSLSEAVAAAQTGDEIVIIADIELAETIEFPADKTITLNLNGKTISAADKNVVKNSGAALTIKNGTIKRTGTVAGYAVNVVSGTLEVEDVTIVGGLYTSGTSLVATNTNISQASASRHAIYAYNCAVTINSGTYHNDNAGNAAVFAYGSSVVTINNGTFSIDNGKQTFGWTSCLLDANAGGKYVINGGEFKGHFRVQANSAMEINGGTFENTHGEAYAIYGTAVVKGGTFTDDAAKTFATSNLAGGYEVDENGTVAVKPVAEVNGVKYASFADAAAAAQAGSEIKLLADATVEGTLALPAGIKLTSNGHTITGSIRMLGDLELNGPLTITGGLWVGKKGETLTATLSGDKLTASYFMFQYGTYTINADIDAVYGYLSYNGTFEVNSTIHTTGANGEVLYINGNVTLNDGAVLDSDNSVFVCNDNAVLTLNPGSKVDSNVSITASGAKLNIDATGMTAGASANITGTVTNSGNGTIAVVGNDKLEAKIVDGKIVLAAKPVAKIGETGYATLDEAVAAAKDGDKITLVDDAELAFASNPMYNNVNASEIDLNGKTMTIKKGDVRFSNTTIKNGNIVVEPKTYNGTAIFLMYSKNLTLDGVKVTATGVASTYLIGLEGTSNLNLLNGSEIVINNESLVNIGSIIADNGNGNTVTIKDSKIEITNSNARLYLGGTNGNITVENSDIDLNGVKEGFYLRAGQTLAITGTSTVDITLNSTEGRYGINLTDLTATYTKAETATVNATLYEVTPAAVIGEKKFVSLQAAIDAVQDGDTITLASNVTENVTVTEKAGLYYTIDGAGKKMNGTITVSSLSDTNDNRRITIKNIKFENTADAARDFITSVNSNHYPRITVEGCTFTGNGKDVDVAVRLKSSHSVVIKDCTGTGLHSFLQNTSGWNLTIENVTVTESKSAFALGTVQGVKVKGCTADVDGYGIRLDAQYNNNAVLESNTIVAFIPVVVRKASVESNITVNGTNTMTATNTDGIWFAAGTSEYETNGTMPTDATGKVRVTLNDANLSKDGVYGDYVPVAKIGDVEYTSLEAAFKAATSGCTIDILSDVTVDYNWDARNTGGKFTVPVTINGNDKTIKFTASVNDNNYQAPFRFEADATVKNLTIDMSEVTDNRFRAISSKGNLTVDGCKFIGKDESLNCRAIIFGEGAGANVGNLAIAITNSEFINWKRGITDNENAQDVKTATITGNTLENAAVYVSAYENVTFTGNTVEGAYVDIRSYTANSSLNVTATGNTLEENTDTAYNYIKATGNIDQEGFKVYAVAKIGDVEYTTIEKAYAALQEGDEIVILKKGSYALKVKNNVTITGAVAGVEFANIGAFGCNGANVTFNNVTFTYAENSTYKGLQHSGNLVYNNCTFNGQVFLYGASETFNNCTFNTTDSNNYNVWTYGAKVIAFNECTFNSAGKSVLIYSEQPAVTNNVTVTKSTFKASQAVEGKAAIEMDSSLSGAINLTIDGETTATGFAAGNVSGNSLWNNKKGNSTDDNNDITVKVGDETVLAPVYEAQIGEQGYRSFQAALAAAKESDVVTLLADVEATEVILLDKSLTINGNGHKVTSSATRVFRVTTANTEVTLNNVNMVSTAVRIGTNDIRGISVDNVDNVKLTLDGCSVDFTDASACDWAYAVNVTGGDIHVVTVNGGTYEGANVINVRGTRNTVVVKDATLTSLYPNHDVYYGACIYVVQDQNSSVEATGNTFNGSNAIAFNVGSTSVTESENTDNTQKIVAKIGAEYYTSLVKAFAEVEDNETIEVLHNVELSEAIVVNKKVVIDLNGKKVTSTAKKAFEVYADATIQNGTIEAAQRCVDTRKAVELTLTDVTLIADKYTTHGNPQPLTIGGSENGTKVAMTNVNISAAAGYGIITFVKTELTATESTIGGYNALYVKPGSDNSVFNFVKSTLSGSTADNDVEGNSFSVIAVRANNVTVDVDAASTVTAAGNYSYAISFKSSYQNEAATGSSVTVAGEITGNILAALNGNTVRVNAEYADELQAAGYATSVADGLATAKAAVAKIGNTNYATLDEAIKAAKAGDTVTVFEGTYAVPSMKAGITIVGEGNVVFEGTLSGTLENLTMKNIHIKGGNAQRWAYAKGDLVFENVTFEATSVYALHFDGIAAGANLTYKNCTIIGWAALGGSPASCVFEGCTIKGNGTYGLIRTYFATTIKDCTFDVSKVNTNDVYQDGIHAVEGAIVTVDNCTNANGEMADIVNIHATSVVVLDGVEIKNAAKIGDNYYLTVVEAINATTEGQTVTVLTDIVLSETVTVPAGKTITLDLNGKTISQEKACTGNYNMILNKGNLTITGNGKISFKDTGAGDPSYGWGSYTVRNEGTLVVENGTIEHLGEQAAHMYCAIFQYSGKSTVNGGTISTPNYRSARLWKGDMTINGGTFDGQLWVQAVDNSAKLTINGGTFEPNGNDASAVFVTNSDHDVQLAVANGTFNGKIGCSDATKLAGAIKGGKFNEAAKNGTNAALLATGLTFGEADANGYYAVEDDPATHYINNVEEFVAFRDAVNGGNDFAGVAVYLTADIDLTGIDWSVNIGDDAGATFDGTFDGQGHTIKNLTSTETAQKGDGYICTGLFGAIHGGAVLKDFTIENVTINTGDFAGNNVAAVVGFAWQATGSIENVHVTGNININAKNVTGVGAILGYDYYSPALTVKNCSVIGNDGSAILGKSYVGGLVGYASSKIAMNSNTIENVSVTATGSVGAIAGIMLSGSSAADNTVKNVALTATGELWKNSAAVVAGTITNGGVTVTNTTVENVTANGAVAALVGGQLVEKPTAPIAKVEAKIGNTYYTTIENAYVAAQAGATVELLAPVVIASGETLTLDKDVTVVYPSNVAGEDMFTNRGILNISAGTITYVNTDATGSNVTVSTISSEPGSVLNITGGTVENKTVKADGSSIYSYAIDMLTNGSLGDVTATIAGGTVYSDYMAIRQFNNGDACKNTLNINGGYIYGAKRAVQVHFKNNAAYTTITDGKIEATDYALCFLTTSENLSVSGGEFIGAVWYSGDKGFISGGTYNNPVEAAYCAEGYMPNKNTDGTYGVVAAQDAVAAVGGFAYATLAEAVKAAKAGDTITLLQDVKESITISKNLSIDGAGNTITGMITTDGKSLKVTIKNVNFDGNNKTVNYAMRADDDLNLVVENCSVKDYLYGFLYANKSNDKIVVKDVTVENCAEYGAYLVAFNSASFENFTVKGSTKYGVAVANAGARTVNFKNVSFENAETPLHINENGKGKVTFNFSGVNEMSKEEFYTSKYVVVVAEAQVGTKVCGSLQDAIAAAETDETVTLLTDLNLGWDDVVKTSEGYTVLSVVEGKNITLNMNEKKITVDHQSTTDRIYSVIFVENGAGLTVTGNGSIDINADDNAPKVAYMFWKRGSTGYLVIENGNFYADNTEDSMVYSNGSGIVTVNGGTFTLDANETRVNGFPWIFNVAGNDAGYVNVNGGTYNYDVSKQFWAKEVKIGSGYTVRDNGDDTWSVVTGITLVDGEFTEYTNDKTQEVEYISYTRTMSTDWNAFYVPFEVPVSLLAEQGFEVAYINGVRRSDYDENGVLDEKLNMELIMIHGGKGNADGTSKVLKANYPYFIRAKEVEKVLTIELTNVTLYAAKDVTYDCSTFSQLFEITGNASQVYINSSENAIVYGVSKTGQWTKITKGSNLKPFRFFMTVTNRDGSAPTIEEAPEMMSIAVRGVELADGTTLIYDIEMDAPQNVDYIYDLQGRRVLEPQKGNLYIINGKKVIF